MNARWLGKKAIAFERGQGFCSPQGELQAERGPTFDWPILKWPEQPHRESQLLPRRATSLGVGDWNDP